MFLPYNSTMATLVGWDLLIIIDFLPGPALALDRPVFMAPLQVHYYSEALPTQHG